MLKSIFTVALCCFLAFSSLANDIQSIGISYVRNYTKSSYLAGNQNWSVTADANRVIYFGNSEGLLSFNGNAWQLYKIPHSLIVRSVAADGKGKVYTGGFGELGYWHFDSKAILKYQSLNHLIPKNYQFNDEIWKIYIDGERVIFQSFGAILIYHKGKIEVIDTGPFLFLMKVKNRFFIQVLKKGLFELKGSRLEFVAGSEILGNMAVLCMLPFNTNSFVIGTSNDGLFVFDGAGFKAWDIPASQFLKTNQLNNGVDLYGKYFAFGTILNGIVIIDKDGNVIQQINKSGGLQNNTVLSLFVDQSNNLWAGLDNGIDRIELNSPLSFFLDKTVGFGTVYSSIIYKDKIYLGTNQGLYYSAWDPMNKVQSFDFKLIPNSQGQVWDLSLIDGELFCGHNNGTFKIKGAALEKVSSINGGWTIKKMSSVPDKLIQGTYNGLVIYNKDGRGKYKFSHKVNGFSAPSRYVEQDEKGNIWSSHAYKGLFKMNLNEELTDIEGPIKNYDQTLGLPSSYGINIFNLFGKIVFTSDSGFYVYDHIIDRFKKYDELNKGLGSFSTSNKVIKADEKSYWFIERGKVALVDFSESGKIKVNSNLFSVLNGRMVQNYENISKIDHNLYLISVDDGFVLYNQNLKEIKQSIPDVIIGKVENITATNFTLTERASLSSPIKIDHQENSIRIYYSLPLYRQSKIMYQYYLEGYSTGWSSWSGVSQKDFTNLPFGTYEFKVRAKVNDTEMSEIASFKFEILPPFYASVWAMFFYSILIVISIYLIRIWYFRKLKKHQEKIQNRVQQERDEHLKQEAIINEQKLIKLKNEKLQTEVDSKSREVTNSAMNIVYKNDLLQKIKGEIVNLKDPQGKVLADDQLKRLQKIIDEGMNDDRDWNLFESSFNETHENFFKKLKSDHPDLVPNDLKLCAYLRMNMSSKEMASMLNISVRGAEIRRYRLRKKLSLSHDKNLVEFLMEL
ncbi:Y_Y_Y domain-containing protein [Daejeonella rubra]|uniref:Y_Y_Y domain-containing protein n=1 Tax=Daejeonella rubra TaxID=990371 RepID=A0A1G9VJT8_9SPHI|nr:triple tyrosine motif-containing protein [Daejeonella rubra]SDM72439.1 Y_Y_Y domain-containing protein [Daejeonella rubra]